MLNAGKLYDELGNTSSVEDAVVALAKDGLMYQIKEVVEEYDPESGTTTLFLKLEEF